METKPQTPDNEVEVSSKQTMLTAQSDSVELYHALCDRGTELFDKINEVARLRQTLEFIAKDNARHDSTEYYRTLAQAALLKDRFATAPEEPVTEKDTKVSVKEPVIQDSRITELQKAISQAINSVSAENGSDTPDFILAEFLTECLMAWNKATRKRKDWYSTEETQDGATMSEWYGGFSKIESTEPTIKECLQVEPAPEWRELGPDEVIQEGDHANETGFRADEKGTSNLWFPAGCVFWGMKAKTWDSYRFRTRRPLPNPNEELPLEDEIKRIETRDARIFPTKDITTCIRYLRAEIQKLKEAK
jgi:hypothetical protein